MPWWHPKIRIDEQARNTEPQYVHMDGDLPYHNSSLKEVAASTSSCSAGSFSEFYYHTRVVYGVKSTTSCFSTRSAYLTLLGRFMCDMPNGLKSITRCPTT
jgi:hypothetical protein